jgi:SAM-dependent methyltransferase
MAHKEQIDYVNKIKNNHPQFFTNKKVLGIGTFNVCGTEDIYFTDCDYSGLDLGPGPGVDIVCPAQDYDAPDGTFDVIISCECFEHNPFYKETIQNAYRMLKPGGMFLFTCATTGRPIHGVSSLEEESKAKWENWKTMPNVSRENWDNDYYKNLTEEDIRECIDVDNSFSKYEFEVETNHCDLYFYGFKKSN